MQGRGELRGELRGAERLTRLRMLFEVSLKLERDGAPATPGGLGGDTKVDRRDEARHPSAEDQRDMVPEKAVARLKELRQTPQGRRRLWRLIGIVGADEHRPLLRRPRTLRLIDPYGLRRGFRVDDSGRERDGECDTREV